MCGIVGIFKKTGSLSAQDILAMTDSLEHRGPDGFGYLCSEHVLDQSILRNNHQISMAGDVNFAFGHRRLAIHDLSDNGLQPMSYANRYWIVFNGEIFNYMQLRSELEVLGYHFKTNTDTEVIMAAYDAWGKDCLNKFNGMWAFVLLDLKQEEAFMARDRFGIKPLYYYQDKQVFIFASEIKAILKYSQFQAMPNLEYLKSYYASGSKEYLETTAFTGIMRFPLASYATMGIANLSDFEFCHYWSIKPNVDSGKLNEQQLVEYKQKYLECLSDAVRLRLQADVKVGSALSGGLDSSTIVALVNQQLKQEGHEGKQETFSNVYKTIADSDCDESEFIDHVAAELDVKSNQIEPSEASVLKEYAKMIYHLECPPDNSLMSSWHTFKMVGESEVSVTLDGQGADELLCGYLGYYFLYFAQVPLLEFFKLHKHVLKVPKIIKHYWAGLSLNLMSRVIGKRLTQKLWHKLGRSEKPFQPINERLLDDFGKHLVTLLHYADSTSMAFSIESRMPFMDYRLVELLYSIPAEYKLFDGWTKYLARKSAVGLLPDNIVWRKDKKGWPVPEKVWFDGALKSWMEETVLSSQFLLDNQFIDTQEEFLGLPMLKKVRLLNLAIWHQVFFGDEDKLSKTV